MEIPIIGRLLRGKKSSPEISATPPAQEPPVVSTRPETTPQVNETSELPDIDREHIRRYVRRAKEQAIVDREEREALLLYRSRERGCINCPFYVPT